jgi:hypothetical protein
LFVSIITSEISNLCEMKRDGRFADPKYEHALRDTLVKEGLFDCETVTAEALNRAAKALRAAFLETFGEVWSFVIFHDTREYCVSIGSRAEYYFAHGSCWVCGAEYPIAEPQEEWADKLNADFTQGYGGGTHGKMWTASVNSTKRSLEGMSTLLSPEGERLVAM